MILKVPHPLRFGDKVALVNPAGILPERFRKQYNYVKTYLEEIGFVVKDFVIEHDWERAEKRSGALMTAFTNPEIKAIFPLCGGAKIHDILPLLNYDVIANYPKIICGSSELSALVIAITERAKVVTFYGPHLNFLNPRASKMENKFTVRSFWNMLQWDWHGKNGLSKNEAYNFFNVSSESNFPIIIHNIYRNPMSINKEQYRDNFYYADNPRQNVAGKLLIGSLPIIVKICEEDFRIDLTDKIVMVDLLDMSLDATFKLFQRFYSVCDFSFVRAIVFSSLSERTDRKNLLYPELREPKQIEKLFKRVSMLFKAKIPLFHGFPVGHCAYKLTLPIGINASIIADTGDLLLSESPFSFTK